MLGAFSPKAFGHSEWINLVLLPFRFDGANACDVDLVDYH